MKFLNYFFRSKKGILPEYRQDIRATVNFINHIERGQEGLGKGEAFEKFNFIDRLYFETEIPSEKVYLRALRFYLVQILVTKYGYDRFFLENITQRRKNYPKSNPLHPDYEDK